MRENAHTTRNIQKRVFNLYVLQLFAVADRCGSNETIKCKKKVSQGHIRTHKYTIIMSKHGERSTLYCTSDVTLFKQSPRKTIEIGRSRK